MEKNILKGCLYGAAGSLWWGTLGVLYFKSVSFAGPIELVVHRTIWTAFSLVITTTLFSKWNDFFIIIKKKKRNVLSFNYWNFNFCQLVNLDICCCN